jgi:hypothetical protein
VTCSIYFASCIPGLGVALLPPVAHGCATAAVKRQGLLGCAADALYCLAWTACCCCYGGQQPVRLCSCGMHTMSAYVHLHHIWLDLYLWT